MKVYQAISNFLFKGEFVSKNSLLEDLNDADVRVLVNRIKEVDIDEPTEKPKASVVKKAGKSK